MPCMRYVASGLTALVCGEVMESNALPSSLQGRLVVSRPHDWEKRYVVVPSLRGKGVVQAGRDS